MFCFLLHFFSLIVQIYTKKFNCQTSLLAAPIINILSETKRDGFQFHFQCFFLQCISRKVHLLQLNCTDIHTCSLQIRKCNLTSITKLFTYFCLVQIICTIVYSGFKIMSLITNKKRKKGKFSNEEIVYSKLERIMNK